jgi:uncharacterized membrane protein
MRLALRRDPLAAAIAALALLGVCVSAYLVYVHYAGLKPVCSFGGGCERVQSSPYSRLAGIPVACLGLAAYAGILASAALASHRAVLAAAATALTGVGFSAYLTYRELFSIHAVCTWCVTSAALMTLLAVATTWRLLRAPRPSPTEAVPSESF